MTPLLVKEIENRYPTIIFLEYITKIYVNDEKETCILFNQESDLDSIQVEDTITALILKIQPKLIITK